MLKIKDNVDLKELEKYGFRMFANHYEKTIKDNGYGEYMVLTVYEVDRVISLTANTDDNVYTENLDILYDLIKDGLVEKVEG